MVTAFFDANALIYLLEGSSALATRARSEMERIRGAHPEVRSALSRLSWLECRVGPLKAGNNQTLALYDTFFACPDLIWIDLTADVIKLATEIRAQHGLRTPDALQAACCLTLGPQHIMLTGDVELSRVTGLNVRLLS